MAKKIIITGGSSGIGKACAVQCATLGMQVAILSNNSPKLEQAVEEIRRCSGSTDVYGIACDISDLAQVKQSVSEILARWGSVDVLVNNAGYCTYQTFAELTVDEVDRLSRVNYLGALYVSKLVLDNMITARNGHVINVASVAGKLPITPNALYSAAKHGMAAVTELLACEYKPFNIFFSLIVPGRVDTPFFDHESFRTRERRPETKGMLTAEQVAEAIVKEIDARKGTVVMPARFGPVIWFYGALPWISRPLLRWLLEKRVREHYDHVGWPGSR